MGMRTRRSFPWARARTFAPRAHERRPRAARRGVLRRVVYGDGQDLRRVPFDRYLFIVHALPVGSGVPRAPRLGDDGHRRPLVRGRARRLPGSAPTSRRCLKLFHAWNVKRACATRPSGRSTTRARTTRASVAARTSPTTSRTSSTCCAPVSCRQKATSGSGSPTTGQSTRTATALTEDAAVRAIRSREWIKLYKPRTILRRRGRELLQEGRLVGMALST